MAQRGQTRLFKTGTKVDLFVTSVQPGVGRFCHFWAQTDIDSQLAVEELMNAVESKVAHTSGPQIVHTDEMCLAKFQADGKWYRSKVVDCHPDGSRSRAKVFFIDYGNSEIVPLSELRTNMHEYFANHPPQAKEFVLADLLPSDGIHWSEREVEYLNDHLSYGEFSAHVLATVCGKIPLVRLMNNDDKTQPLVLEFPSANIGKSYNNAHFLKSEFPRNELPLSTDLEAFVTYSLSPVKFWIQLESDEEQLNQLRLLMEAQYGHLSDRELVCNFIDEGTLCAGVCSIDGSFYRAVVEECRTDGFCRTFFIDYGNSETASIQNFRFKILPDQLKCIPAYAFECTLAGIPPGMHMTDTHIAIFRDLVNDIVVKARFLSVNADGVYTVALFDKNGNSIVDVMKLGSMKPLPKVVPAVKPIVQKPVLVPAPECATGTEEDVFITLVESPDKFFGQLVKYSGEVLNEFQNKLMEHYEANSAHIPHLSLPSVGDYCCAKYTSDDMWYRAQVTAIAGNKLDLIFIDYGDKETDVPVAEVKVLDPRFVNLPQQGIFLKMTAPVDKSKFEEIIDRRITLKLEDKLGGNYYSTTFSEKNERNVLQLLLEPQACQAPNQSQSTMQHQHYKELVIDPAKAEAVTITHVNNPESFYCQPSKTEESLNQLMDDIHNIYSKLDPRGGLLQTFLPGIPCVAQFTEDQGWYRASVVASQGDKVKVFYLDYGNSEELSKGRVRMMDPRFLLVPAQAIHCTMHNISYVGTWPPERVAQFEEMVTAGSCMASFLGFDDKQSAYEVELLDANGVNINEKFGKATRTLARAAQAPPAPTQAPSSPQRRPPGIMYQKIDLPVGVFKDVAVVHTETPSEFYCQLIESSPALNDLMDRIDLMYTKLGPTDRGVRNPVKGMPCCAKFTVDDVWYRAEITDILGNIITVQFVDYGNGETLSVERVKELKPEFLQLGAQAIKCCLKELRPKAGEWSDAAIDRFADLTDDKNLVGSVIKKLPDGTVEMELIDTESDLIIGQELCKLGDCVGPASVPVPMANSNAVRSRSSSGSSSGSNPPRQRTSPRQSQSQMSDRSAANKGGFGGRQPSGGRSDTNDWKESAGNRFLDRLAGGDEETKPYRRPEWPGERESKGRSFGNGDSRSQGYQNKGDGWGDGGSSSSFGGEKQERSFGKGGNQQGFGSDRKAAEKQSFGQTAEPEPVPPYKELDLSVGKKHSVLITWNETTCDFWCQLSDNQANIGKMMVSIQGEYNRKKSHYTFTNPTTGSPCMALYAGDGAWYRGKITKVEFGSCKVLFVDYGNQEEIQKSNVMRMKPEFMSLPIQGIHCQLQGVKPVSEKWTEESKRKYEKIMTEAQPLQFVFKGKSGGVFKVETEVTSRLLSAGLVSSTSPAPAVTPAPAPTPAAVAPTSGVKKYKVPSKSGRHQGFISQLDSPGKFFMQLKDEESLVAKITDQLVQICEGPAARSLKMNKAPPVGAACVAKYAEDGAHYRAVVESLAGSKICVRFVDFGNAETVDLSEILEINDSLLNQIPLAYECTFAAGATWNDADGDQMHNLTADKELTVEFVTRSPPFIVKLFDGQTDIGSQFKPKSTAGATSYPSKIISSKKELGYVSHIDSLSSFYVQLASEEDDLVALSDQLHESYDAGSTQLTQPAVGTPCVTRFSEDNAWYRALITKVVAGKATVRFVDYGNGENVNLQDIKALKTEFTSMPPFAAQCSLPTNKSSQADADKFSELTADKQLTFHFSSSEPYTVKVFDGTTDIGARFCTTEQIASASYPKQSISCGAHKVYVSHIENPDQFFVQLVAEEGLLDTMTTSLTQIALTDLPEIRTPQIGMPCVAEFSEDSALYRGVVTKVSAGKAEVRFSDFGNTDTLPLSKIRAATDNFVNKPPIAIECTLGIGKTWDQDAVDKFSGVVMDVAVDAEFINTNSSPCQVKLRVDGTDVASSLAMEPVLAYPVRDIPKAPQNGYTSHVVSVKQFYIQLASDENALESLSEKLNSMCEALPRVTTAAAGMVCGSKFSEDDAWYRAEVVSVLPGNKAKVVFVDYGNTDEVDAGSLRILPADLVQKPVLAFECKLEEGVTNHAETINKFTNMTVDKELKVVFLSNSKPTKVRLFVDGKDVAESLAGDASPATDSPKYPEYILSGNKHKACVCHVESPAQFYIQMVADDSKLNELMDQLDGHYSANATVLPQVTEGVACVCRYSEDNGWYRGKVIARCDATVTVQFVDYGNCEDKSVKEVYSLVPQFSILPPFALECTIGKAAFSKEETEKFQTLTSDKEFAVTFSNETSPYAVQLFDGATDLTAEFKKENSPGVVATSAPVLKYPRQVITKGTHKGYVSHVDSLTQFYIQLQSQEDALNSLAEQLDVHYSSNTATQLEVIAEGVPCATLYSADGHWYRGMITGIGHDIATVQFIDYGNSEDVSHDAIKVLAADFISQPPFGYKSSIGDKATFTPEDSDAFTEQTAEKLLDVEFCTDVSPYIVRISEDSECLTSKYFAEDGTEAPASETAVTQIPLMEIPDFPVGAFISHINSPVSFYLQFASGETELNNLMEKIKTSATRPLTEITVGSLCLAKYSVDETLYRAEILSQSGDEVHVLFIDYGNAEQINRTDLTTLGADVAGFPRFAVHCKLGGITWPEGQVDDQLHSYQDKELMTVFDTKTEPCSVTLLDDTKDLKELFSAASEEVREAKPEPVADTHEASTTAPASCKYFKFQSYPVGATDEFFIAVTKSPGQFWCQKTSGEGQLAELTDSILADETLRKGSMGIDDIHIGAAYLAKFTEDDCWYRATVLKMDATSCSVLFVDYGNQEVVPYENISPVDDKYLELPACAIECFLNGASWSWTSEATEKFTEIVAEKNFNMTCVSVESSSLGAGLNKFGVSLVLDEADVLEKLIEEGLAKAVTELKEPMIEPTKELSSQSSDDVDLQYVKAEVKLENKYEVTVSFITSPSQFWLQCSNALGSLDALMAKIEEIYAELSESDKCLQNPAVGQPCVVKYSEDGSWYRGQIAKVLEGDRVEVYFVDYGNSEETDLSCLKTIESSMMEQPMHAIECLHAGMKSIEGPWSAEAIEVFSSLVQEKKLICEFLSQETDCDNPCIVQLRDMGISIVDKMVEEGVAEHTGEELSHFLDASLVEPDAAPPQETDDAAAPSPLVEASEETTQVEQEDVDLKAHYVEYKMPQLDPGSKIDVFVTSVTDPTDFWCQLADSSEDLPLLMDTFHEYCRDNKDAKLEDELVESLPCIACTQDGEDQAWYRAKVMEASKEDVNVCFVDYGNMEDVSRDKLYKLQQEHIDLPLQAFKCSLKDVKPIGDNWDPSACTRFEELTYDKKLKLEITDVQGKASVLSVYGFLEEGEESVLKKLIDEGYAKVKEDAAGSKEEEVESKAEEDQGEDQEVEGADDTIEYNEPQVIQELDDNVIGKSSEGVDGNGNNTEEAGDLKEPEIDVDADEAIRELDDVLEKEGAAELSQDENVTTSADDQPDADADEAIQELDDVLEKKGAAELSQDENVTASADDQPDADADEAIQELDHVLEKEGAAELSQDEVMQEQDSDDNEKIAASADDQPTVQETLDTASTELDQVCAEGEVSTELDQVCAEGEVSPNEDVQDHDGGLDDMADKDLEETKEVDSTGEQEGKPLKAEEAEVDSEAIVELVSDETKESDEAGEVENDTGGNQECTDEAEQKVDVVSEEPVPETREICDAQTEADDLTGKGKESDPAAAAEDGAEIPDSVMQEFARNTVENIISNAREVLQSESQEDASEKLPSLQIIADDKLPVVFTHWTSPHDFYLQPKSSSEQLSNLMQEIASWCEMEEATESTQSVGDACLAHEADGQWYRARITSVDNEQYQVIFIDTGMKATVDQTRPIPDEFQSLPCQAVRCRLGGLKETHSSMNKYVKETFTELCSENLLSRFVEKTDDGYYSVYLYNSEDDIESVNFKLVEAFGLDVIAGSELEIAMGTVEEDSGSEKGDVQESADERPDGQVNGTEGEEVDGAGKEVQVKSVIEEVEPTEPTSVSTE